MEFLALLSAQAGCIAQVAHWGIMIHRGRPQNKLPIPAADWPVMLGPS